MAGTLYPQFCICPIQQSELYSTIYAVYLLKRIAFKYKQIVLEAKNLLKAQSFFFLRHSFIDPLEINELFL